MAIYDPKATSVDEREVTIVIQGGVATIYSCDPLYVRKFDKKYTAKKEDKYGKTYKVPASFIKFGSETKRKARKPMTDEEKAALVERLRNSRRKNNND